MLGAWHRPAAETPDHAAHGPVLQQCASRKAPRSNAKKLQRPRGHVRVFAAALAVAGDSGKADAQGWLARQKESVTTLLTPFSDSAPNAKLLALCSAQVCPGFSICLVILLIVQALGSACASVYTVE